LGLAVNGVSDLLGRNNTQVTFEYRDMDVEAEAYTSGLCTNRPGYPVQDTMGSRPINEGQKLQGVHYTRSGKIPDHREASDLVHFRIDKPWTGKSARSDYPVLFIKES
jgi:hypothetical protein